MDKNRSMKFLETPIGFILTFLMLLGVMVSFGMYYTDPPQIVEEIVPEVVELEKDSLHINIMYEYEFTLYNTEFFTVKFICDSFINQNDLALMKFKATQESKPFFENYLGMKSKLTSSIKTPWTDTISLEQRLAYVKGLRIKFNKLYEADRIKRTETYYEIEENLRNMWVNFITERIKDPQIIFVPNPLPYYLEPKTNYYVD